jgi:hypothetical protein
VTELDRGALLGDRRDQLLDHAAVLVVPHVLPPGLLVVKIGNDGKVHGSVLQLEVAAEAVGPQLR